MTIRVFLSPCSLCFSLLLGACNGVSEEQEELGSGGGASEGLGGQGGTPKYDPGPCKEFETVFASELVDHKFGSGQDFGQEDFPALVLGAPVGGGTNTGSLHVVSLGDGGFVELAFSNRVILDGKGADFIVFENPFLMGGEEGASFAEPATVSVSMDGAEWHEFPCDADDLAASSCAGVEPVVFNIEKNSMDQFNPSTSGGDLFDLADLGLDEARYVRIVDVVGDESVFDLDAVAVINGRCKD